MARKAGACDGQLTLQLHWTDPPGPLPLLAGPWNADFVEIVWVTADSTKSEVQQGHGRVVLNLQKVPLQGPARRSSVPGGSVWRLFCRVEVKHRGRRQSPLKRRLNYGTGSRYLREGFSQSSSYIFVIVNRKRFFAGSTLKLPGHRPGASRKGNFILIVPLDPARRAGLAGHLPARGIR